MMAAHFRTLAAPARAEAFHRIGLPMDCADQVGLALIRPAGDGLFDFDDQGDVAALILPVVDCYSDDGVEVADYADLVAFDANDPRRVWSLNGSTELLGEDNLASLFGCKMRIHRSPLEWLIADRDGVAIVKWTPGVAAKLHSNPGVLKKQHRKYAEQIERRINDAVRPAKIFLD
jgi:hypothetical protein